MFRYELNLLDMATGKLRPVDATGGGQLGEEANVEYYLGQP
jgi:hypothetical protein